MAIDAKIIDGTSGNPLAVNAAGQASVILETNAATNPARVGAVKIFSENDGESNYLKSPETGTDFRLRVGMDTILKSYSFNSTAQDTANWRYAFATLTAAQPGAGTVNFGAVQGTANAHGAYLSSFQYFPLVGTAPISVEFTVGLFNAALVANETCAWGIGVPTTGAHPADGVFLFLNNTGLYLRIVNNGTIIDSAAIATMESFTLANLYKFAIVIGEEEVEVWRDDKLLVEVEVDSGLGQPFQTTSLPVFAQKFCTGSVTNTNTFRVSDVTVSIMDIGTNMLWSHQASVQGLSGYQGLSGGTQGSAQFVGTITTGSSPLNATAAAGSNTTPAMTTLGGLAAIQAPAGAATDFIIMGWTNPIGSINITPRTYILTALRVSTLNLGAVVAGTPTTMLLTIGFGSTAATLVTAESATFATGTTKIARRVQIGYQTAAIGTVIGAPYTPEIMVDLTHGPIVVNPGEVLHLICKVIIGTATASQTINFCVTPIGYYM